MLCDYITIGKTLDQHKAAIGAFMGRLRGPRRVPETSRSWNEPGEELSRSHVLLQYIPKTFLFIFSRIPEMSRS